MARTVRNLAVAASLLAIVAGVGIPVALDRYHRAGPLTAPKTVVIAKGASVQGIAQQLTRAGVIDNPWLFRLCARVTGADLQLRAGEYVFPSGVSVREVIAMLHQGKTLIRRLTVPEGLTSEQIVRLVRETEGMQGEIPTAPGEGSLLPQTYHFSYGETRARLIERMSTAMRDTLEELWPNRTPDLPLLTPMQAVTLASIIEEETSLAEERPRVAAVFINRLRLGMRLQADPTVAYAITDAGGTLDRPLTQNDLQHPSPYNTYLFDGLPPGPISNPGRAALAAALNPAKTDELYFVADGSGGHAFARTLEEHQRNVARWRSLQSRPGSGS